ncbi:MAG: hypothetical protein RLZ12_780 [Bacillota bacterium]
MTKYCLMVVLLVAIAAHPVQALGKKPGVKKPVVTKLLPKPVASVPAIDTTLIAIKRPTIPMGYKSVGKPVGLGKGGQEGRIVIFQNQKGQKWVLKQNATKNGVYGQYMLISEIVGARIAEGAQIPMQKVRPLSATASCAFKTYKAHPATLHTFITGAYKEPNIWQRKGTKGVDRAIVTNMSRDPILTKIAAFDTFIANDDRNNHNLFWTSKGYVGIDTGDAWQGRQPLAEMTLKELPASLKSHKLTTQERAGLIRYATTLKKLVKDFPAPKVCGYIDAAATVLGLSHMNLGGCKLNTFKNFVTSNISASAKLAGYLCRWLGIK